MEDRRSASDARGNYQKLDLNDNIEPGSTQDNATKDQSSVIEATKQTAEEVLTSPRDDVRTISKTKRIPRYAIIGDNRKLQQYKDDTLQGSIIASMVCQSLLCFIAVLTMRAFYWVIMLAIFVGVIVARVLHLGLLYTSFYQANPGWSSAMEFIKSYAPTTALLMVLASAMLDDCKYTAEQYVFWTYDYVFRNSSDIRMMKYEIDCGTNMFGDFMLNSIALVVAQVVLPFMTSQFIYKRACGVWKLNLRDQRNQRALTFAVLHVIDVSVFGTMAWEVESFVFLQQSPQWQIYYKCVYVMGLLGSLIYALQFVWQETCMHSITMHLVPMMLIDLPMGCMRGYFLIVGLDINQYCFAKNVMIVLYTPAVVCCGDDNAFVRAITELIKKLPGGDEADNQIQEEDANTFKHQKTIAALMKGDRVSDKRKREALVFFDADDNGSLSLDEVRAMLGSTHYSNWLIQEAYQQIKKKKSDVDIDDIVNSEILRQTSSKKSKSLSDCTKPLTHGFRCF